MKLINKITEWLSQNYDWLISLIIEGFIAYHVFFLSKKLSNKTKLKHKEKVKQKTEKLLSKIFRQKLSNEVYLVNINRYFKDYPSNKEKRFEGYSHIRAEIKSTRFDGIEFFSSMPVEVYKNSNGKLSFKGEKKEKAYNAFPVGVVPYEWVEHVDIEGDEYGGVPLFYCYFKGKTNWKFWKRLLFFGYPYKRTLYYRESDTYREGCDPADFKYKLVESQISK